ncbi:hypothetical protein [Kitasatospora cineracea]|uniref:hypothetical protein n=1 Tax=Kitasatospora cineracea TaxID=88074 RepID=UPI0033E7C76C
MSRTKQYIEDSAEVEESAVLVAHTEDHREALRELGALFRRCGVLAAGYADPELVARMLVQDAAETYRAERWLIRSTTAALAA